MQQIALLDYDEDDEINLLNLATLVSHPTYLLIPRITKCFMLCNYFLMAAITNASNGCDIFVKN